MKKLFWILSIALFAQVFLAGFAVFAEENELGVNLLDNPDFEEVDHNGIPVSWHAYDNWESADNAALPEAARTGNYGVQSNGWVRQTIEVEGGQAYEWSAWMKSAPNGKAKMKVEFYRDSTDLEGWRGDTRSMEDFGPYEDWEHISMQIETPEDANLVQVYFFISGSGTAYHDDVSFHRIAHSPGVQISTNEIFYYDDMDQGVVKGTIRPADGMYDDKSIEVEIFSDENGQSIFHEGGIPAEEQFMYTFDPRLMSLHDPYTLVVTLKSDEGDTLFEDEAEIYRWERPTMLRSDGTLIVDGEPFFPVYGYGVKINDFPIVNELVNTVSGSGERTDRFEIIRHQLDEAHKHGLKVVQALKPTWNEMEEGRYGYEFVKEKVRELKDHPALLAWNIADEPDIFNTKIEELAEVYKIVRTIDPDHPVYMVVANNAKYEHYYRAADIAAPDSYPLPNGPITTVGDWVGQATSLFPQKPVWSILQAFKLPPSYPYLPNIKELRHMAYQSILSGAQGLAYYAYAFNNWDLMESELYPGFVKFNEDEIPHIAKMILHGQKVDSYKDENVQWGLWEVEGTTYAIVMNVTENEQNTVITLPNEGYQIETIAPDYLQSSISDNELAIELSALETTLIKLTPFTTIADLQHHVERFESEGEMTNHGTVQALNMHLTAIQRFEQQEEGQKIVKHMHGFQVLLDHHYQNAHMTEAAYEVLQSESLALIQQKTESLLQMHIDMDQSQIAEGEPIRVEVQLANTSAESIEEPTLTIQWPEAFGLDPTNQSATTLLPGDSNEMMFQAEVPVGVELGQHSIKAQVQFKNKGVNMGYERETKIEVIPLTEVKLHTTELNAKETGEFPVTFTLQNNSSQNIQLSVEGEAPEGLQLDLQQPIEIPAGQEKEIEAYVRISDLLSEGEHTLTIFVAASENHVHELPITVNYSRNLVVNPSFEADEDGNLVPDGWNVRDALWVQDEVYSGQYAMSMIPDADTTWNVFNSLEYIPVKPGASYRMGAWVKVGSPNATTAIGVRETDSAYGTLQYHWEVISDQSDWTYYEFEFTPSSEASYIHVYVDNGSNSAQTWFDDFRIEEVKQ